MVSSTPAFIFFSDFPIVSRQRPQRDDVLLNTGYFVRLLGALPSRCWPGDLAWGPCLGALALRPEGDVRTDKISPVFYRTSSRGGRCPKGSRNYLEKQNLLS